jgi:pentatricopeptide repeat protein
LAGASADEKIVKYEEFLKKYPKSERVSKALAQVLNQEAWNMATAAKDTPGYDPQKGLKYAVRAVELDPHPNNIDTMAEAYLACGQIDEAVKICREMLKKYPNEKMFSDRLERCQKIKACER